LLNQTPLDFRIDRGGEKLRGKDSPSWLEVAAYGSSLEQLLLDGIKDIAYAPALEVVFFGKGRLLGCWGLYP